MVKGFFLNSPSFFLFLTIFYDAQDVYRIGTLMELVRVLALSFADDGKQVKVILSSLPLTWIFQ